MKRKRKLSTTNLPDIPLELMHHIYKGMKPPIKKSEWFMFKGDLHFTDRELDREVQREMAEYEQMYGTDY